MSQINLNYHKEIVMDTLIFLAYEILVSILPFLIVFSIIRKTNLQKGLSFSRFHTLSVIAFSVYIVGVYHFTGAGTIYDVLLYQLELRYDQLNFTPFSNTIDIVAYLLNILLCIPLGFLAPVIGLDMNKLVKVIGVGFLFTFLIELSQLFNNRRTDIDDILLNVLGAAIGFMLYKLFDKLTKSKFRIKSPNAVELTFCILFVFASRFLLFNEMGLAKLLYGF